MCAQLGDRSLKDLDDINFKNLEDRSFKRLTDKFKGPMLKYLRYRYEMLKKYATTIEVDDNTKQYLNYVIQIYKDVLVDIEFHSGVLRIKDLRCYGTYKINLREDSGKSVHQTILCTADPKHSKRHVRINGSEGMEFDVVFTLEDDADEKIKILEDVIDKHRQLTNTDIEIIYLTVALYMESSLSKSELLLKIATLTNQVEGLSKDELNEIKIFQKAFMKKFISDDDELKGEIDNMIGTSEVELIRALFPEGAADERNAVIMEVARNMKGEEIDSSVISKVTGLSLEKIEEL